MVVVAASPRLAAQSPADLSAWNALAVSPVGALPVRAVRTPFGDSSWSDVSINFGIWHYDEDDAIHNNFAFTYARSLSAGHRSVAATLGYLSLSCGSCAAWLSGGVDVDADLVDLRAAGAGDRGLSATLGLRASVGGAHYLGEGNASAISVATMIPLTVAFETFGASRMSVAFRPGMGVGRFSSVDEIGSGIRPIVGASVAWAKRRGPALELGMQRVFITRGPSQLGASLSWRR